VAAKVLMYQGIAEFPQSLFLCLLIQN